MKVFSFHTPLSKEVFPIHDQLIDIWHRMWGNRGWETVLLGMDDAKKHPDFEQFSDIVDKFPTVNTPGFDHASWVRWLAFEQAGAGFIADYDCLNMNHFAPLEPPSRSESYAYEAPHFEGANMFIHLTLPDLRYFIGGMVTETPGFVEDHPHGSGNPHVSDMIFFNNMVRQGRLSYAKRLVQHCYEQPIHCPILHLTRTTSDPTEKLTVAKALIAQCS